MNIQYHCDYCNAGFTEELKHYVEKHEDCCHKNPKNKACYTCKYKKLSLTREYGYYCKLNEGKKEEYQHVDEENCNLWDTNNIKLSRKLKLQQINERG